MEKACLLLIPVLLFLTWNVCAGLECYHCYQRKNATVLHDDFVPCNENNLTASNVRLCPSINAHCLYLTTESVFTQERQIWRTCSSGGSDPCDPNFLPPGIKMIECSHCKTDRCNLDKPKKEEEDQNREFTFNINANVNLYIRQ